MIRNQAAAEASLQAAPALRISSSLPSSSSAGVLFASRLVIIGCGYATYVVVAHRFSTEQFGIYGVMAAIINVLTTVVGTGTNQAISRLVSRHPEASSSIVTRGLWWSAAATLVLALVVGLGAPVLASLLRDGSLTKLLVIAAAVPGLYAFTACYSGLLNGMGALARQGFVTMAQAVSRLVLIGTAAVLGYGVEGTLYGSVLAALVGALVARRMARIRSGEVDIGMGAFTFARMMVSFVGVSLLLQLLLANDVLLIKRLLSPASADQQAGIYTAAQSIARIPYYVLIGISQIVYPRLSASRTSAGVSAARRTSTLVLSGMLVMLAGILALCVPLSTEMLLVIYPERYADGGEVLGWLLGSSAALSVAESALTMLSGAGGPRRPAIILGAAVVVQLLLCLVLIPLQGPIGAAQATLVAAFVAAVAAFVLLRHAVGTSVSGRLVLSAIPPALVLAVAASQWARVPWPRVATLAFLVCAYGAYLITVYRLNAEELRGFLEPVRGPTNPPVSENGPERP